MAIFALVLKVKDMSHLSKEQRYTIFVLREEKVSIPKIAENIKVNKTTVYREIKRNWDSDRETYNYTKAQLKYEERLKNKPKHTTFDDEQKSRIRGYLMLEWSPEQMKQWCILNDKACPSHERIYQFIWEDKRRGGNMYTHLRRKGRRRHKRGCNYNYRGIIPNRVDIDQRPKEVDEKQRFGDLEGDTVIGKGHKGAIVTINDRLTSFSWSKMLPDKSADGVSSAIIELLLPFKGHLHTLTFDNGREFVQHQKIADALNVKVFFAKPYHSWERGANENLNGLYRQYFPKGSSFEGLPPDRLPLSCFKLNHRPRKKLGFLSPIEKICRIFASNSYIINQVTKLRL